MFNGSGPGAGLDARSVVVGGGLVLAGMVAAHSGAIIPLAFFGLVGFFVGQKKGWWGDKPGGSKRGPFAGPPAAFDEWQRQTRAAWSGSAGDPADAYGQQPFRPASSGEPGPRQRDVEFRIPVTEAPGGAAH